MCEPTTIATIGTTVASAVGTAASTAPGWLPIAAAGLDTYGKIQDLRAGAKASDAQATAEAQASAERAARLKAQGMRMLAEQRLQTLASGIEGGTGSALEVGAADAASVELDALTELYGGTSRTIALRKEAKGMRAKGRLLTGGLVGAAAALAATPVWGALSGGKKGSGVAGKLAKAAAGVGKP